MAKGFIPLLDRVLVEKVVGGIVLSESGTANRVSSGEVKCAATHVCRSGAGSYVVPAEGVARLARNSFGSQEGSSRKCYHILSSAKQVQQRDYRESSRVAHFGQRKLLEKRSRRCFSEPEKAESESAEPSNPSCCNDSTPATEVKEEAGTSGNSTQVFETYGPGKRENQLFALASVTVAVGLFLSGRLPASGPGLPELAATAISYQEALSNGRPTVVEFYADWCEVCQETAHDVYEIEREYKDQINFVMLNVDNSKWEGELDEFGVEGIPHFAFLDREGNEEGNIVGRLPRKILEENLAALARGDATVPHSRVVGQFSNADSKQAPPVVGPRSHSPMS